MPRVTTTTNKKGIILATLRLATDDVIWLLGAACQLHHVPFDASLIRGQSPPPHTIASLQEFLVALGLNSGEQRLPFDQLPNLSAPCFVGCRIADSEECTLVLLLHSDGERVLSIAPDQSLPVESPAAEFRARYAGFALLFAPEARLLKDGDDPDAKAAAAKFGFRWFIPEFKKHKQIWRDVLLASLSNRIVGSRRKFGNTSVTVTQDNYIPDADKASMTDQEVYRVNLQAEAHIQAGICSSQ